MILKINIEFYLYYMTSFKLFDNQIIIFKEVIENIKFIIRFLANFFQNLKIKFFYIF